MADAGGRRRLAPITVNAGGEECVWRPIDAVDTAAVATGHRRQLPARRGASSTDCPVRNELRVSGPCRSTRRSHSAPPTGAPESTKYRQHIVSTEWRAVNRHPKPPFTQYNSLYNPLYRINTALRFIHTECGAARHRAEPVSYTHLTLPTNREV